MPNLADFELRTMPGLYRWHAETERQLAFRAKTREEAEDWQAALREKIAGLLGLNGMERAPLDAQLVEASDQEGYRRELVVIQTTLGEYMPCYVLIPESGARPFQAVIALHGHGKWGANGIIGLAESAAAQAFIEELHYDYARQLAKQGFLVFAPMLRGFAERMEHPPTEDDSYQSSCQEQSLNALLCGKTLLGLRVWDVMRLIDYVQTRAEPIQPKMVCAGLSGGGTVTVFTTALEARIGGAVVSGYFNTFRDSIMAVSHCACNYVPNLLQYAEMPDVVGLIAPRPLFIESGRQDPIFPVEGVRRAVPDLQAIYDVFGAGEKLHTQTFEGEHRWDGKDLPEWLNRQQFSV